MCYNKFANKKQHRDGSMDKQNYTLKNEEKQELNKKINLLFKRICKQLEEHQLIKRKRKVVQYQILVKATMLYIIEKLSYQRLSDVMSLKFGVSMSDTSWKKQLKKTIPLFYEIATDILNSQKSTDGKSILVFSSAYAIDATDITLQGKKGSLIRVHTGYSLSEIPGFETVITDIHTAESVKLFKISEGSLYFADRAYGKNAQMEYVLTNNAHFVFRISPSQVCLYSDFECKNRLVIAEHLDSPDTFLSVNCYFKTSSNVYPVRIIASPIPQKKAEQAVKRIKRKASKCQRKLQESTVFFAGWIFIATSLPSTIPDEDIVSAYRERWQIELHFKRTKTLLNFHTLRRCSLQYAFDSVKAWIAVSALIYSSFYFFFDSFGSLPSSFNLFSLFLFFFS